MALRITIKVQQSIKSVVLDVLKLRDPDLPQFALSIGSIKNIETVKMVLVEIDQNTESLKVTIEGQNINLDRIRKKMKDYGAVIHSIDEVIVGSDA
jgi:hypothetical protein